MMELDLNILLRLLAAGMLAAILGWEREQTGKAAGIRTHMLVGVGAALFVVLGELFVLRFREYDINMRFDPLRIIQAVVTGISFLGAGTIFVTRDGDHVKGLTTAASIWVTAAIGMLSGLERYLLAIAAAGMVFCVLRVLPPLKSSTRHDDKEGE